jgi:hypothetical protein
MTQWLAVNARCPGCSQPSELRITDEARQSFASIPGDHVVQSVVCRRPVVRNVTCNTTYALTAGAFAHAFALPSRAPRLDSTLRRRL